MKLRFYRRDERCRLRSGLNDKIITGQVIRQINRAEGIPEKIFEPENQNKSDDSGQINPEYHRSLKETQKLYQKYQQEKNTEHNFRDHLFPYENKIVRQYI